MKIILSRKGFDSSSGGVPSPILPNEQLLSLPIPDHRQSTRYCDLQRRDLNFGQLVEQLTKGKVSADRGVHLDPDLSPNYLPRTNGWRPTFGQYGAAQAHLNNQGVAAGDVFLFFGLFNSVIEDGGVWRWQVNSAPSHRLWGYLQIGEILPVQDCDFTHYPWLRYHAHSQFQARHNTFYIGADQLVLSGRPTGLPGTGVFHKAKDELKLTAPNANTVSQWRLPKWFYPSRGKPALSYHGDKTRWRRQGQYCALASVARGQEFVLDGQYYPQASQWLAETIALGSN